MRQRMDLVISCTSFVETMTNNELISLPSLAPPGVRLVSTSHSNEDTGSPSRRNHASLVHVSQRHHKRNGGGMVLCSQ